MTNTDRDSGLAAELGYSVWKKLSLIPLPARCWQVSSLPKLAEALLNAKRLCEDGILASDPIWQMWQEHVSGQRRWYYHLWDVLMLQAWLDEHAVSA